MTTFNLLHGTCLLHHHHAILKGTISRILVSLRPPQRNGNKKIMDQFLLTIIILLHWNYKEMSLAADSQQGNGLQLKFFP